MSPDSKAEDGLKTAAPRQEGAGLTLRQASVAIGIGLFLIFPIALFIRQSELVIGLYSSTGVPPVPVFAALLFLTVLRIFLRRYYPHLAPSRAQVLLIYVMLTLAGVLNSSFHVRAFLPHMVSLQYWGRNGGLLAPFARFFPSWYAPHDMGAIRDYYDGAKDGSIPWDVWLGPLFWWTLFWIAMCAGTLSLTLLVQRRWIRQEKLSFPLLAIPLAITSDNWSAYGSPGNRKSLFCIGFAFAAVFNGLNILHGLYPSVPSIPFAYTLTSFFPNRPWTHLGVNVWFIPEAIGMGYFVPLEVLFSCWFFFILTRFAAVAGTAAGYDEPGFPFGQEQVAGGYLAMGLLLIWGLRRSLWEAFHFLFRRAAPSDPEAASERWAWLGLLGSSIFILGFCYAAGMTLRLAVPYFAVVGLFVLVYARIRAEAGVPFHWIFPINQAHEMTLNAIGVPQILNWGTRSFVIFYSMTWLSTHPIAEEQAAYQIDSLKVAEGSRIPRRILIVALLLAFAVGLWASYWVGLSAYYAMGTNTAGVHDSSISGEYRARVAQWNYEQMGSRISSPPPRDSARLTAAAASLAFTLALALLRRHILGFPFHPLGFVLANGYILWWFSFLIAWFVKAIILRYGGLPLYRRGIPFFLGMTVGHLFLGGVCWPIATLFLGREVGYTYFLMFGT
ncbi:MAG: hypothetical protein IT210_06240 [Armatimonadetes bacterium]|nr:hypothetical protein [Armatimonadota bacterium]